MEKKHTLIICASFHHKNTWRISEKIADILNAKIIEPKDFKEDMLDDYALIGFGSGIYNGTHHKSLLNLVSNMNDQTSKRAFVFSTSTVLIKSVHKAINDILIEKGFVIMGQFYGKGFMNHSFTKYIFGGFNKRRPNEKDYEKAINFARKMKESMFF